MSLDHFLCRKNESCQRVLVLSKDEIAEMGCCHVLEILSILSVMLIQNREAIEMKVKAELIWELNLRTRSLVKLFLTAPRFMSSFLEAKLRLNYLSPSAWFLITSFMLGTSYTIFYVSVKLFLFCSSKCLADYYVNSKIILKLNLLN